MDNVPKIPIFPQLFLKNWTSPLPSWISVNEGTVGISAVKAEFCFSCYIQSYNKNCNSLLPPFQGLLAPNRFSNSSDTPWAQEKDEICFYEFYIRKQLCLESFTSLLAPISNQKSDFKARDTPVEQECEWGQNSINWGKSMDLMDNIYASTSNRIYQRK